MADIYCVWAVKHRAPGPLIPYQGHTAQAARAGAGPACIAMAAGRLGAPLDPRRRRVVKTRRGRGGDILSTHKATAAGQPERQAPPAHTLPPLPYEYDALEPYIDERTMRLHHDIHHRSYVEGLNRAEAALARARRHRDWTALNYWQRQLAFHGSGHFLHSIFWTNMHPDGGGRPTDDELLRQIQRDFGSFDAFRAHFTEAANALNGPGWVMLVWQPMAEKLEILQTQLHHCPAQWTAIPILVLDLWEHAYYLQYRTRRPDYIESWWNVVNWPAVARRWRDARRGVVSGGGMGPGGMGPGGMGPAGDVSPGGAGRPEHAAGPGDNQRPESGEAPGGDTRSGHEPRPGCAPRPDGGQPPVGQQRRGDDQGPDDDSRPGHEQRPDSDQRPAGDQRRGDDQGPDDGSRPGHGQRSDRDQLPAGDQHRRDDQRADDDNRPGHDQRPDGERGGMRPSGPTQPRDPGRRADWDPGDALGPDDLWSPDDAPLPAGGFGLNVQGSVGGSSTDSDGSASGAVSGETRQTPGTTPAARDAASGTRWPRTHELGHDVTAADADESLAVDDDYGTVETLYGPAAAIRRAARGKPVQGGTPRRSGTVRYVYGRRASARPM